MIVRVASRAFRQVVPFVAPVFRPAGFRRCRCHCPSYRRRLAGALLCAFALRFCFTFCLSLPFPM